VLKRSSKFKGLLEARYRCECHSHEIEVSQWQDGEWEDNDVYMVFWYSGRNFRATTDKLKAIWRILRGMTVHQEEIILTPREAHELGRALLSVEDPDNPPTMNFPSPTNTTTTEDVKHRQGGTPR
jgi:hypothetical protein